MPAPNWSEYDLDVVYAPETDVDLVPTKIEIFSEFQDDQPQNLFLEHIPTQLIGGIHLDLSEYAQVTQVVIQCIGAYELIYRFQDARTGEIFWGDLDFYALNECDSHCNLDPAYGLYLFCNGTEEETRAHVVIFGRRN